jgi:hypothetical protein
MNNDAIKVVKNKNRLKRLEAMVIARREESRRNRTFEASDVKGNPAKAE